MVEYNRILTCGTFDLYHIGHINMLKKAKKMGNYLVVGISSDKCNKEKNKKSVISQEDRYNIVKSCKYVDEVFIEDSLNEKENYVKKYNIDLFVIGEDWKNKFDFLSCDVQYLPRTENISTTQIKKENFPNIWYLVFYEKYIHNTLNYLLTKLFLNSSILVNPNYITYLSFIVFVPIYFINNRFIKAMLFLLHDLLDRCDGVMARIHNFYNIKRDEKYGAYLDAMFDKLFVIFIYLFLINDDTLLELKVLIHIFSAIKRTHIYLIDSVSKNKSTISGKMGTFLENISLFLYFYYYPLYQYFMTFSIILTLQSLYEKF